MHLVIDGYSRDRGILRDVDLIYDLLDDLPDLIGMTKIANPRVFSHTGKKIEDWGVSGIVLIAESHISIHTFVERAFVNVDVFSCKSFDTKKTLEYIKQELKLERYKHYTLERGLEFLI